MDNDKDKLRFSILGDLIITHNLESHLQNLEISNAHRAKLLDKIVGVCQTMSLSHYTFFTAINILDLYLMNSNLEGIQTQKDELSLLGITSLYIAIKVEEIRRPPTYIILRDLGKNKYSKVDVIKKEKEIL